MGILGQNEVCKNVIFFKNTFSKFHHIAPKDTFWVNDKDEKMIGTPSKNLSKSDISGALRPNCVEYITLH